MRRSSHAMIGKTVKDEAQASGQPSVGPSAILYSRGVIGTTLTRNFANMQTELARTDDSKNMTDIVGELANRLIIEKMKNDIDIVQKLTNKDKISKEIEDEIKKDEAKSGSKLSQKVKNMLILAGTLMGHSSAYEKDKITAYEKDKTNNDLKGIKEARAIHILSESINIQLTTFENEEMANTLIGQLETYISKSIKIYGENTKPEVIKRACEFYQDNENYKTLESIPVLERLKYLELLVICQDKTEKTIKKLKPTNSQTDNTEPSLAGAPPRSAC